MAIVDEKLFIRELDEEEKKRISNDYIYHPPTLDQERRYDTIRFLARFVVENIARMCPRSRELSLAVTHFDEAFTWAIKAIARNEPGANPKT
jgi:hypothetical protein